MKSRSSNYFQIAVGLFALIFVSAAAAQFSPISPGEQGDMPLLTHTKEFRLETIKTGDFSPVSPQPIGAVAVPEPGSLALLAMAGAGALLLSLRRRRQG